ncbi:MAG: M36 family metallopeptidase, partial [Pyrinomonadaceae bacterium]
MAGKKGTSKVTKPSREKPRSIKKNVATTKSVKRSREAAGTPLAEAPPRLTEQTFRGTGSAFPENFHALYDRGFRSARGLAFASEPKPAIRSSAEAIKGVDVQYDEATQVPCLVVPKRPTARLAARMPGTPESAVTEFVLSRAELWGLQDEDTATIEVVSVSEPKGEPSTSAGPGGRESRPSSRTGSAFNVGNLRTVNMLQRVEGREVFNSEVTGAVNLKNEVVSVAGQFFLGAGAANTRSRAKSLATAQSTLTPAEEAIARAAFDLTNHPHQAADFRRAADPTDSGPYRFYEFVQANASDARAPFIRPVRVKDVMFPLGEGEFVPAYYMELWIKGFPAYSYVMDAIDTPDLLYRKNLTSHVAFKYRVHNTGDPISRPHDGPAPGTPHPRGVPDGFQAKVVAERLVNIESLLPGDPWLPPDATTTDGNNCIAFADLQPPDGFSAGDVMGKITSAATFDHKYDHTKSARDAANLQNSIVGMFFHVNWLHDRWYEAGFDEASGNAQKNNFGRGGIGGDPILAEGNDFSGTDNANMGTPADGSSPIMQMFEFLGPSPQPSRTSNHEALITFHEMGHYITNR